MLDDLAEDLARDGVQLAIARDVGPVRELIARTTRTESLRRAYPTVRAAVDALTPPDRPSGSG